MVSTGVSDDIGIAIAEGWTALFYIDRYYTTPNTNGQIGKGCWQERCDRTKTGGLRTIMTRKTVVNHALSWHCQEIDVYVVWHSKTGCE